VRDLDRAVALDPEAPEYRYNRAVALVDLGRAAAAAADFRAYLRLDPGADDREDVLRRLDALAAPPAVTPG
jgi:cytochrome c-type biogenesis protein CcmH/NrfG